MRAFAELAIPSDLLSRLASDAREQDQSVQRHAAQCIAAAARLYALSPLTSAAPCRPVAGAHMATIGLTLGVDDLVVLSEAASEHGMTLQRQLVAVLDAAAFVPPAEPARIAKPAIPAMPKRRPFDPKYYAEHSVAFR